MFDPGLSLKSTTLPEAWRLIARALGVAPKAPPPPVEEEAIDAIEAMTHPAGLRSRRMLLDAGWWRDAGPPMIARVAERRRIPRGPTPLPSPSLAAGTGWVALVPDLSGYRMLATEVEGGEAVEWRVDEKVAGRLAPFAFTFLRRFDNRALRARDMLRFARMHGGRDLALLLLTGFAVALVGLFTPMATGWLIDRAIPSGAVSSIQAVIAGLAVAGASIVALDVLRALAGLKFEARIAIAMQAALVDRVISAPASFFRAFASGDLALRMGSVNTLQHTITGSTIGTFITSVFLLANLTLMMHYSPALTLAASGIAAAVIAISTFIGLARLRIGPLNLLQPAATILILWLAWRLQPTSGMTTGDFVAFHAALFSLLGGVHAMITTAIDLVNLKPVWDRARPILEALPEDALGRGEPHEPRGAIELKGVSFAYPNGPEVLHGIDLAIAPGEFVAIVGASGSGKSTLLRLLLGFEAPLRGEVAYDGRDLKQLDLRYLRRRIGTVLQGGRLWAGDLLTNILGASNAGVAAATEAARAAGLEKDIEAMPMGVYTVVGEGLSTLSGGQRQRVLIARALVSKPRILLLDEATSALDNVSQAVVLEGLTALKATRVVIAHRLNTVRDADRIVVLDRGRVVQQGTFAQLAAEAGPFAAMLSRQVA